MSDEIRFPAGEGVKRILVTGFDPYTGAFDEIEFPVDPRRPNPSGATALALDGTKIKVDGNVVFIESVIFPNRWLDFDEGIVEDALGPFLESGPRQVHALPTLSQAGEAFELEHWNGRYRTGPDNMGITTCCEIDPPSDWPALEPVPQWTESTLPFTEILAAGTGPFPVVHDMSVQEFPLCGNTIVERADGPSAGSCSFAGSGGNFLSNEAPYRATHLRDALGVSIPVGHVHTPNLALEPIEPGDITNTPFESRRASIVEQATAIVHVIALTLD